MKDYIMHIQFTKEKILDQNAELLVIGLHKGQNLAMPLMQELNEYVGQALQEKITLNDFQFELGQNIVFPGKDKTHYIILLGLGDENSFTSNEMREAAGHVYRIANKLGVQNVGINLFGEHAEGFNVESYTTALTEALTLANYAFTKYKERKQPKTLSSVIVSVSDSQIATKAQNASFTARRITDGVILARDLVNTPAHDMNPMHLAETARQIADKSNGRITLTLLDEEACRARGMGAYLAVAQGSDAKPVFIHLHYKPEQIEKSVALVGKGVTFDSGGLSLKPSKGMETMKCDMAGSAAVLGAFESLTALNPHIEVHGIIAATENMPSGKAIRPGDVVRASNGKSIEILNTDAEGRLTLADALTYAQKLKVDYVIDLATLTGACVVALGEEISSLYANDDDMAARVMSAAASSGEYMWMMPLHARYTKLIDSKIADVRNIATSRYGGSITAALFLQQFIHEGQKWCHIDIAGPAFAERSLNTYTPYGGTGYGVATLIRYIQSL